MPTYITTVRYREGSGKTRVQMAKEINNLPRSYDVMHVKYSSAQLLQIVDALIAGTPVYREHIQKADADLWVACDFLDCTTEISYNQYEQVYNQLQESYDRIMDLRTRGAAGDVEAAIAYCRVDEAEIRRLFAPYAG